MDADLRRWLESELRGSVTSARRGFGGGSRQTWFVELTGDDGLRRVVVRHQGPAGAFVGTDFTLGREALVYRALQPTPVPVAELLAVAPDENTLVLSHLPGKSRIDSGHHDEAASEAVVASFFGALGQLHRLDPAELDLPGLAPPADAEAHARDDLARWRVVAAANGLLAEPMIAYAFAWLEHNAPTSVARTVLTQGDTGPGNFLHDAGRVTGLVDWEFAHIGDPMDDIAWVDMRAGTVGPFADTTRRDRLYRHATGVEVDPDAVRYYTAMVQLRCAVTTGAAIERGGGALGLNAYGAPHHRFLTQLGADLADAAGFSPIPLDPLGHRDGVEADEADLAVERLRAEMADQHDASTRLAVRERLLAAEHGEAVRRWGEDLRALDVADVRSTIGAEATEGDLTARAASAGVAGDERLLGLLVRRAQRRQQLWDTPAAGGHNPIRPPSRPR